MPDGSFNPADLRVTTHIGRALLASAEQFRNEAQATSEYVLNGLQYVDPGVSPVVHVAVHKDVIAVTDNGRGMDFAGLANFFTLHGENLDRKAGNAGRGRFGTGKSAAFAIADHLRVTTVRDGRRCSVELRRADVQAMRGGDAVPVRVVERDVVTAEPNGTTIEMRALRVRPNRQAIIDHVRREIAGMPDATVVINGHHLRYQEPELLLSRTFRPEPSTARIIGDVALTIKVARRDLPADLQGTVAIRCNRALVALTDGGHRNKELADRLFGEIDVPRLDDDNAAVSAFDASRSLTLNRANEVAQRTLAFIAARMDEVRKEIVEADRRRRAGDDQEVMRAQVTLLEKILNTDLRNNSYGTQNTAGGRSMPRTPAPLLAGMGTASPAGGTGPDGQDTIDLPVSGETSGQVDTDVGVKVGITVDDDASETGKADAGIQETSAEKTAQPAAEPAGTAAHKGEKASVPAKDADTARPDRRLARSGITIAFTRKGQDEHRTYCPRGSRLIEVNLDHPQIAAACRKAGPTSPEATRVVCDAVAQAYSHLIAREMIETGTFSDQHEVLTEVGIRLDRIYRALSSLYA